MRLCRAYYQILLEKGNPIRCPAGKNCGFRHPISVNQIDTEEYNRQLKRCYCGSFLKTIINKRAYLNENAPQFFVVCSKTLRSMRRCKRF
jgi:hypothetical protein